MENSTQFLPYSRIVSITFPNIACQFFLYSHTPSLIAIITHITVVVVQLAFVQSDEIKMRRITTKYEGLYFFNYFSSKLYISDGDANLKEK